MTVAVYDLEVYEVDVHRVEPAAAFVGQPPRLHRVQGAIGYRPHEIAADDVVPGVAAYGPMPVISDKLHLVVLPRRQRLQVHDLPVGVELGGDIVVREVGGLGDHVEAHDLTYRVVVDVVGWVDVLQDDLVADFVLGEIYDDLCNARPARCESPWIAGAPASARRRCR